VTERDQLRIGDFGKEVAPGPYKPMPVIPDETRLEMARESIARWREMRTDCDQCERESYHALYERAVAAAGDGYLNCEGWLKANGWEHLTDGLGSIRRCSHHGPKYPWAADLDPVKVVTWIDAECAKHRDSSAFLIDFDALREACT
jgi:hypothetical protein